MSGKLCGDRTSAVIVLDTHALIWWVNGDGVLSAETVTKIESALSRGMLYASAISAWEITLLVEKERLALTLATDEWLSCAAEIDGFSFYPVNWRIAASANRLPGKFHRDPADRIIVATTMHLGASLITFDERITRYPHVNSIPV